MSANFYVYFLFLCYAASTSKLPIVCVVTSSNRCRAANASLQASTAGSTWANSAWFIVCVMDYFLQSQATRLTIRITVTLLNQIVEPVANAIYDNKSAIPGAFLCY